MNRFLRKSGSVVSFGPYVVLYKNILNIIINTKTVYSAVHTRLANF